MLPSVNKIADRFLSSSQPFSLNTFIKLRPEFDIRETYLNENAAVLDSGGSRIVWDIGGDKVLKLNFPGAEDTTQTRKEIMVWKCSGQDDTVLARIYDYDQKFHWLTMELVEPIYLPVIFQKALNSELGLPESLKFSEGLDGHDPTFSLENLLSETPKDTNLKRYLWLQKNPSRWWTSILHLVKGCKLEPYDMKIANWGLRNHQGLVLLDYGFEL